MSSMVTGDPAQAGLEKSGHLLLSPTAWGGLHILHTHLLYIHLLLSPGHQDEYIPALEKTWELIKDDAWPGILSMNS